MLQTTVYFANNQLQILQGEFKKDNLMISKFVTVPMQQGGMINGVITNEDILFDALQRAGDEFNVDFKETKLVINTSLAINKNVPVPKLKPAELEEVCANEFEDSSNFDKLVMDYKGIAGKEGATNMFAVAIEKDVVASYKHLFDRTGIKLKGIDTALSAVVDYIENTADYDSQTFALYVLDGNNLLYILFENGRYTFSSQARILAARETEAFYMEVTGKLSSLVQFHESQKSPYMLNKAYFSGATERELKGIAGNTLGMDIACEFLPTTHNIAVKHAMDDDFYLDLGLLPAAAQFESKDSINLLRAYEKASNPHKGIRLKNKALIPPLVIIGLMIIGLIGFAIANLVIQNQIKKANQYINDATNAASYSKAQEVQNNLSKVQEQVSEYTGNDGAIASYPGINADKLNQVVSSGDGVTVTNVAYDANTGSLEVTASAGNAYQGAVYVNNLVSSGLFSSVDYGGYTYSQGSSVSTSTTTASPSPSTTASPTYNFTYKAVLKGGS